MTHSRRQFLWGAAAAPFAAAVRPFVVGAGAQRTRTKIRDLQVLMLQGPGRTYTLVKVIADSGHSGIAEAYGSPGVGVKEQILSLKPWLVGKDPLQIDTLYTQMGQGTARSCCSTGHTYRTDSSGSPTNPGSASS